MTGFHSFSEPGPIVVDIITKNKIKKDVPVRTELATPAFDKQVIF